MFFIVISLMLLVHINMQAADVDDNLSAGFLHIDYRAIDKIRESGNENIKDRVDQANDCLKDRIDDIKELKNQAFDRAEFLLIYARHELDRGSHSAIVDAAQNITKAIIASALGIGAVIGLYQATKVAIAIAYTQDENPDKEQYVAMYSYAGIVALCVTCSALCYWSIN